MRKLAIIGAGGHGRVVADCAMSSSDYQEIIFIDDCYPERTQNLHWPIENNLSALDKYVNNYDFIIALGNNEVRQKIMLKLENLQAKIITLVHHTAVVSPYCTIGRGGVVFANAVVNIGCTLGDGVIINTSASIDHDCTVGDFTHISPGVHVAGGVKIGKYSWLGIGCSIVEYIEIATNTTVGAGAVVHKNTSANQLYVGVPASPIKSLAPIQ